MKFKIDENLPVEVAEQLQQANYDALTVYDQEVVGAIDESIAKVCLAEEGILVTLDLDFSDIRAYPPEEYPGKRFRQDSSCTCNSYYSSGVLSWGAESEIFSCNNKIPLFHFFSETGIGILQYMLGKLRQIRTQVKIPAGCDQVSGYIVSEFPGFAV